MRRNETPSHPIIDELGQRLLISGHQRRRFKWARTLRLDPCVYCGCPFSSTIDHIVARYKGGPKSVFDNGTSACRYCNERKATDSLLMFLLDTHPLDP